jgi:eukaryotic-like serine/threonine-protein kinase
VEGGVTSETPSNPVGVRPGDILAGKYRVERVLGVGGMGVVLAAHHIQLDEKVALKFLLPHALAHPEAVARFIREARTAAKIKSEHVARVSDVGQLETGAPYMVMEYLEGEDLSGWLEKHGALPVEQAVDFVLQACVAVADAHALGIVHRDLKPANLFCVRRSDAQLSIKVLDFGISKSTQVGASGPGMDMTKTSALMGTPLYMSPEQMRASRDVDGATDIWALGVILFELLAGEPPFAADTVTELVLKVATDPPLHLRSLRADMPPALDAVIGRCLEKDRTRRYRNVGELASALLPFAGSRAKGHVERIAGIVRAAGLSGTAPALAMSAPGGGTRAAGTLPPVGRTTGGGRPAASRAVGFVGGGIVALVAVAGTLAGVVFLGRHPEVRQDSASAAARSDSPVSAALPATAVPASSVPPVAARLAPDPAIAAWSEPSVATTLPASTASPPSTAPAAQIARSRPTPRPGPSAAVPAAGAPAAFASAPAKSPVPNCSPPYVIDENGDRQYKLECMRR